jgi:hypothetical protein
MTIEFLGIAFRRHESLPLKPRLKMLTAEMLFSSKLFLINTAFVIYPDLVWEKEQNEIYIY